MAKCRTDLLKDLLSFSCTLNKWPDIFPQVLENSFLSTALYILADTKAMSL